MKNESPAVNPPWLTAGKQPEGWTLNSIFQGNYDGILISNGPGDPAAVAYGIKTIRELLTYKIPMFGICLGHQLIALAADMKTFKLPFGHRGSNHPVRKEDDKTVEITSQNHGFAVSAEHLKEDWRITHINLNDGTIEGLAHTSLPIFSIQPF
ncbi:MAG: gamma-glutamyl-gamma-aminobutyrate hydrolase family protein [Candidatus Hatepunaea meridiana]|nr:gamma-glutamyl-gamma-aminobutyrate hydrolase family protein [Candidatus Hatepunaea meridiana]